MRQNNVNILPSQSGASGATSAAIPSRELFACSAQINCSATEAGTAKLQASNDDPQDGTAPTHWSDIPNATATISAGTSGLIPKTDICYQWVRVVYAHTGGTGNVSIVWKSQGV